MPDLEAFTDYQPTAADLQANPKAVPQQFGWRYEFPPTRPVRVGRVSADCDWTVQDEMVSGLHAVLEWDPEVSGGRLKVARADAYDPKFKRPRNPIWYQNKDVDRCSLAPGEWFVIGRTRFTLRTDRDAAPSPVDETVVQVKQSVPRDRLSLSSLANPAAALKAMARLPNAIRLAATEAQMFRSMIRVILDALPAADAAAIVVQTADAPGGRATKAVEQQVRHPIAFGPAGFVPSGELTRRALADKVSCLHLWSTELTNPSSVNPASQAQVTMAFLQSHNHVPWAVCTPLLERPGHALYVTGRVTVNGRWATLTDNEQARLRADLTEHQKVAELIAGLAETGLQRYRLDEQVTFLKGTWPRAVQPYLDDPARCEALLKPKELPAVTTLFCDLRDYTQGVGDSAADLVGGWRNISEALGVMGQVVTLMKGVVAGYRGDAILGFWGWPGPIAEQPVTAVKAAVEIAQRLRALPQTRRCGLGLTHGRAVVGRLGTIDLGVVDLYGPVVNLAARLEATTKAFGVDILVTEEVAAELRADPTAPKARPLGRIWLKGFRSPVPVFDVCSSPQSWTPAHLREWAGAVAAFEAGDWDDARDALDNLFSADPAAQSLLRVMDQSGGAPPDGWENHRAFVPVPPK